MGKNRHDKAIALRISVRTFLLVLFVANVGGCMTTGPESLSVVRPVWPELQADPVEDPRPSLWPVLHSDRIITSEFGYRPSLGGTGGRLHKGIDIAAPRETPIIATAPGRVIQAGFHTGGYGNLVVLQHKESYETWYAHLNTIRVREGQRVERGEIIGGVGRTGRATGNHLHYEVRIDGEPVDPRPFIEPRK